MGSGGTSQLLPERCCDVDAWEMGWRPRRYTVQRPRSLTRPDVMKVAVQNPPLLCPRAALGSPIGPHSFPLNTPEPPDRIAIIHLPGTGKNLMAREMLPAIVGLGFRAHSGWAALVAVGGSAGSPTAIVRRRIELADPAIAGSVQPFHAAEQLDLKKAEKLIQLCTDSTNALARQALRDVIHDLRKMHYQAVGSCILLASGRPVGTLDSILASHAMIHTAEGEFFRNALRRASEASAMPVTGVKEREILGRSASELGLPAEELRRRTVEMGRLLGPPWRQDEKLATLAGWLVLASESRRGHTANSAGLN
jgi:hypothetical protein